MIDSLISSKTRIKLLLKFFLNDATEGYLRGLESEFGESSNGIRIELNRLSKAGLLKSHLEGNKRIYTANQDHPLYDNIHSLVRKHIGLDRIVEAIVKQLGDVERVYLAGSFSQGIDSGVIDLILVGDVDKVYLIGLIEKVERIAERKIRYLTFSEQEVSEGGLSTFVPVPLLLWDRVSFNNKDSTWQ
jgi:hypothetical protein